MGNKDYILKLIKESVSATAPTATVILFGSYARGDYNEESDIDLVILLDQDTVTLQDKQKVSHPLYDIELQAGTVITPMFYTRKGWAEHPWSPFYESVKKEGREL